MKGICMCIHTYEFLVLSLYLYGKFETVSQYEITSHKISTNFTNRSYSLGKDLLSCITCLCSSRVSSINLPLVQKR